jgi:hypothetical protein
MSDGLGAVGESVTFREYRMKPELKPHPLNSDNHQFVEASTTPESTDAAHCPLCGESNACAMEAARSTGAADTPGSCWCLSVDFTAALKMPLPGAARGVACICARCAARTTARAAATQTAT